MHRPSVLCKSGESPECVGSRRKSHPDWLASATPRTELGLLVPEQREAMAHFGGSGSVLSAEGGQTQTLVII